LPGRCRRNSTAGSACFPAATPARPRRRRRFDAADAVHSDLAAAALHAAEVAARVEQSESAHFTAKRRLIRRALEADGVAETIERLVDALLPL
jgi:hypothetical protein